MHHYGMGLPGRGTDPTPSSAEFAATHGPGGKATEPIYRFQVKP